MTIEEILIGTALLGSALVAGIFFAFSAFVMKALAQIPSRQGIAAMQSINVVVINRMFLGAFFGTAATCLVVVLQSLDRTGAERIYLVAGSALYCLGCVLVTLRFNVPLNNRLASVQPDSEEATDVWTQYLSRWVLWNHVRTTASFLAALMLLMGY